MSYRVSRFFKQTTLPEGRLAEALTEFVETSGGQLHSATCTLSEQLPDYTTYSRGDLQVSDFEAVCSLAEKEMATFIRSANDEELCLYMRGAADFIVATVSCQSPPIALAIFERLKTTLTLTELELKPPTQGGKVFISHGRSQIWRELKDFIQDRLGLEWDEFNRETPAGKTTVDRLKEMLKNAGFAFLIMTGEDEHADQSVHDRENVIHEIGLFQGRLEFEKAIVLLEDGCEEFSNINCLSQIRFPKGNVMAKLEEIRQVLEREGIVKQDRST